MCQTVLRPVNNGTNETTVDEKDSGDTLSRDETFYVLRNRRQRYAIHYLKQHDGAVTIGELADQVTALEHGIRPEEITAQQRKRIYNSLQQTHLPKLARTGFVEVRFGARNRRTQRAGRTARHVTGNRPRAGSSVGAVLPRIGRRQRYPDECRLAGSVSVQSSPKRGLGVARREYVSDIQHRARVHAPVSPVSSARSER